MATATYRFVLPGRYIGQTVTVFDQSGAQVASGAVGADGVYSVALAQGDYYATTADGRYIDADQSGPGSTDSDAANAIKAADPSLRPMLRAGHPTRTLITAFQSGHGWGTGGSGGTGVVWNLNDTTDYLYGSQGVTVTTAGTATNTDLTSPDLTAFNMTGRHFALLVKVDNPAKLDAIYLLAGDTTFTNYYNLYAVDGDPNPAVPTVRPGEWTWVHFGFGTPFGSAGTPPRSAITKLRLRISDANTGPVKVSIGALAHFAQPAAYPNGVITFGFDDTNDSHFTKGRPILDKYGYPGVAYTIADLVGQSGYMTNANLDQLHDKHGWDIAAHAYTQANHNADYSTLPPATVEAELVALKKWLRDRSYRGSDFFAWPKGGENATISAIAAKYFTLGRGTNARPLSSPAPDNFYRMRGVLLDATIPMSNYQARVDAALNDGAWISFICHGIVDSGASSTATYLKTDFQTIVDYVATKGVPVRTVSQVMEETGYARPVR